MHDHRAALSGSNLHKNIVVFVLVKSGVAADFHTHVPDTNPVILKYLDGPNISRRIIGILRTRTALVERLAHAFA